ncbi:MAG: hypothetical protein ACKVQJ_05130 [Pyrinomonadaceae bacterium]
MKLAIKAYAVTLILLTLVFAVSAQDNKISEKEPRNTAPTFGTGGNPGGPTGLFTIYDGQTLRRGEYSFSIAYSNYDRDPGNADITEIPASFNIGLSDNIELFFSTNAYRQIKVNSPGNLSGFYLPNSVFYNRAAIVLAPGTTGAFAGQSVFRPAGMPFAAFPFTGANAGNYNIIAGSGPTFGFPPGNATLGPPRAGGGADLFPGVGSAFGSILPGVVFSTTTVSGQVVPVNFNTAPSYLPDAPFVNRGFGESSFGSFTVGAKIRFNNVKDPWGIGVVGFYQWYPDVADNLAGFNQLQRGAGPGSRWGDFGGIFFVDDRVASWANVSANVGYKRVSNPKGNFGGTNYTLLDRPDELSYGVAADFPVNKFFQPIAEFKATRYIGSRTPNSLENHPMDGLVGVRIFPQRWFGMSFGYRINFNQQDQDNVGRNQSSTTTVLTPCPPTTNCTAQSVTRTSTGTPDGFSPSSDPHGYFAQFFIGRRNARAGDTPNKPASVDSVTLSDSVITLPCGPGKRSRSNACNDNKTITVNTTASDPENDVLTYNYTVSGGRVTGATSTAQWDLSGAQPGTYTITVGVDDGCGVCGKTVSKTITVEECPDCVQVCECPTLSVNGPSGVTSPGSPMTFTANVSGGTGDPTYNWSVSAGTISGGQGTSSITVDTTGLAGKNVTATVEIGGLCAECTRTASETAGVADRPVPNLVDEFGKAVDDIVKGRVDTFFIALNNDPNARGYIINYGTPAEIKKRRAQIMKAINFRKYDVSRITFVDGPNNGTGINTKFYLVPAGADNPTP